MKILETEDIKYNLIKKIGNGGTCTVYKGYPSEDQSRLFAIKLYTEDFRKYFEKEILIHDKLQNTNLFIPLIKYGTGYLHYKEENFLFNNDIHQTEKVYYEIEDLAENGELFNYVYELKKGFNERIAAKIFLNILKSVNMLHKKGIIHGDIKPENILIGNDFNIKLIDFGFSQTVEDNDYTIHSSLGTDTYCAPEITKSYMKGYDGIKSDIFSLGVLLFVIKVGKFPFNMSNHYDKRYRLIMGKNYEEFWQGFKKDNVSEEFKDFFNHLICYDPSERFSVDEILEHPWIVNNTGRCVKNEENNLCYSIDDDVLEELKFRRNYMNEKTN